MMIFKMFTGLAALALSLGRKPDARPNTVAPAPPCQPPPASRAGPSRVRRLGMPEERARFIAAFLKRAFRGRTVVSIFCHEDRPFPDIHVGGKVESVNVRGSGEEWDVTFSLNHYLFFVDGHVDIELEKNAPLLRVDTAAGCGAAIQLMFMPEGGYGPGDGMEYHDLWAKARLALDRCEYFVI